ETVEIGVAPRNGRKYRLQMRVAPNGHLPLRDTEIRSAHHPGRIIRPRLPRDPVQRVIAIRPLLPEHVERALGIVPPTSILNHERVSAQHPSAIVIRKARALSVRSAHQD